MEHIKWSGELWQSKRWVGVWEDDEQGHLGVAGRMANSVTWVRGGLLKRAERATNPCSKVGEKDEEVTGERWESLMVRRLQQEANE